MEILNVKRKIIISIFTIMLLIYGVQGVSYSQDAPDTVIEFSDLSLAKAVRSKLRFGVGDGVDLLKIPKAQLVNLTELSIRGGTVRDLSGLEHATNLRRLDLWGNRIVDITPLAPLTQLTHLDLGGPRTGNDIIDITPLAQLTQLRELNLSSNQISDITPLSQLTELTELGLGWNNLTDADITPLSQLTRLTELGLGNNQISDITPIEQLTQLTKLYLGGNQITNLNPLAQLTRLTILLLEVNQIRDLSPIVELKRLTLLYLSFNQIRDVTPLTQLAESLTELHLNRNQVRDVTPLAQLTYLEKLHLQDNQIRDVLPLASLTNLKQLKLRNNPITDTSPLSVLLDENPNVDIDVEIVRESGVPTLTASTPQPLTATTLNESVVTLTLSSGTFERLRSRIRDAVTISGITDVTFHWTDIERVSDTEITIKLTFTGSMNKDTKLILTFGPTGIQNYNGPALIAELPVPVSAAAETITTSDTTISISPSRVQSPAIREQLTFSLDIIGGKSVAGYQASVQFDTSVLRYVSSANGDYLPTGAFFVEPVVEGNLVKLNAASLAGESNGNGTLATLTFEVIVVKASTLKLSDVLLSNNAGESSRPQVEHAQITEPTGLKGDVNGDGIVNIQDLVLVASNLGQSGQNTVDVNGDGQVNIQDLVLVAGALGTNTLAPSLHSQALSNLTVADVRLWLSQAQNLRLTDTASLRGIQFLDQLLTSMAPKETVLLANYPNPFNPETWIPYQLAKPADVTLTIYTIDGQVIRQLALGYQAAGTYQSRSRAAYWDGKNEFGEPVASGIYFYMLTADDFSATRKMLIRK